MRIGHSPDQQVADERHEAHCDDEMPKVPTDCLMTRSSSEPAGRPDAPRNCADHPETGAKIVRREDLTTSEASTWCADHTCKKGCTRHADRSIKHACLRRENCPLTMKTHGQRSGGCGRVAGALISAREALVGVDPGRRSRTREAHSHPYSG